MSALLSEARNWVIEHYGKHARHLLVAEIWLTRIDPVATEAMLIATVTHDMERAFPEPDSPKVDPSKGPADPIYNQAHSKRSARIVSSYLRTQQVSEQLIDAVAELIRAHEIGGWPEANRVQAADSLSFLEVNVDYFLERMTTPGSDWTPTYVRAKFDWMYNCVQLAEARVLATSLHDRALQKLQLALL